MYASVIIEYNVKSLDKTFDYIIPNNIKSILKVGHKVLVPFGKTIVEGFVLKIHNNKEDIEYKEIYRIVENDFYLNHELLNLGLKMKALTLSNLISCYQVMLPKALKASNKTNINRKYETYLELNKNFNILKYIEEHSRRKKEIEVIEYLMEQKKVKKSNIKYSGLKNLIKENIIIEIKKEVNRDITYIEEAKLNIKLTNLQQKAYEDIINEKTNKKVLLYGVTGSGKTEVYIKVIEHLLKEGKTSIVLVPEISLTPQIVARFKSGFGESVAVLHSRLSEGEKYDEYRRIFKGEVSVVVGARSAIFAPLKNIGLIIIDECQSTTYKQENNPKYNAIDIAFIRSEYHNALCILGSATPSLEQFSRGVKNVFKLVSLNKRINNNLPKITLVDMTHENKKRNFILSELLKTKINERLLKKEQIIVLLNRRGYSTFISCSSCGFVHKCPNCDISLIYHKTNSSLTCHYCGYRETMSKVCPHCHEESIKDLGLGTEKLESILEKEFPNARVLRMDVDTTSKKGSHQKLIESFKNFEYDILVGTQMISKGLNFPNVTLVGVLNIDSSLSIPDFRSSERTFELLMQTGGRSARYDLPGEVIIQTYNPDNYVLKFIKNYDFIPFYNYEMEIRKNLKYPPYYFLVSLKIISEIYESARDESNKIKNYLSKNLSNNFIILGPSTARIFKLKNKYHFGIIIKYKKCENLFKVLEVIKNNYINDKVKIDIDINPLNII